MIKKLREELEKLANPQKAKIYQGFFKTGNNAWLRNRKVSRKTPKGVSQRKQNTGSSIGFRYGIGTNTTMW